MKLIAVGLGLICLLVAANVTRLGAAARVNPGLLPQAQQDDDGQQNQKDDGQKNNKDDGQQNQKDDGQKNNKDDGQKNNKDDGQQNQKDDGQKNNKDDGQQNQKDDGQQNQGVVKQVDAEKNTITLVVRREGKEVDRTFALKKNVSVRIADKESDLADLKAGMRVALTLSKDAKTVVAIKDADKQKGQNRK